MADTNDNDTPTTTAQGDGFPDPNPTVPVPDAGGEPVKQATAPAANTIPPPVPADYEMPDDYATQDPLAAAKAWVEAHPGLAVLAAAGAGLVIGRIVTGLVPDPDPPTIAERVEKRARVLQKEAKKRGKKAKAGALAFADDAGDSLQESLTRASDALRDAASKAGDSAEEGYEKTKDLAETIADAVKVAMTGVVATKIDDWVGKVRS